MFYCCVRPCFILFMVNWSYLCTNPFFLVWNSPGSQVLIKIYLSVSINLPPIHVAFKVTWFVEMLYLGDYLRVFYYTSNSWVDLNWGKDKSICCFTYLLLYHGLKHMTQYFFKTYRGGDIKINNIKVEDNLFFRNRIFEKSNNSIATKL